MKIIIQGFASKSFLFNEFIKYLDKVYILENKTNSYEEIENQLNNLYKEKKERFDILGWSLGSIYALNYTLNYKERVNSLFLIGATVRFIEKEGYENGIKKQTVEKMLSLLKKKRELVMKEFYNNIFQFVDNKERIIDNLLKDLQEEKVLEKGLKSLIEYDLIDKIEEIKNPIFICQGINDNITPKDGAMVIKNKTKNCNLKLVDGGHSYFLEKPEKCAELWKKFLTVIQ